jgi:tetratricopeptide (TPR) repeat protein
MQKRIFQSVAVGLAVLVSTVFAAAQQAQRAPFDVTNYRIDAQINPTEQRLEAVADVTFTPLAETRSVTFELNGSLKVESITRIAAGASLPTTPAKGKPTPRPAATSSGAQITFVQDQVGVSDIGPNVKIDLGETVPAGTPVTLRFKYAGVLATAEGGPLLTKRLAYVGSNNGYLMYAARWFPFHDYAADRAASDITISLPAGYTVAGFSDTPATPSGGKNRFVQTKPTLPGSFAYGKFAPKTLRYGGYELQFNTKIGTDALVPVYGEILGRALEHYTKQYGEPDSGKRLIVAQSDDDTLDFYSAPGMIFIADKYFEGGANQFAEERLQREAAYQWWGLSVGLKSFDDAWLSQGLAEYSALELREAGISNAKFEQIQRELLEKSLTFEQTASLLRAPSVLDDTSTAYQYIMFGKGPMVFRLLRETLGADKFNQLLRQFLAQYRGKNASIDDFEKLTTQVAGQPMRYFFARWVESTGVPEFTVDYQIIRTRDKKFITRGTVKQNYDNLRLPVELQLVAEGEGELLKQTVMIEDASADFNIESTGKPIQVVIDPKYRLLRTSEDLKVSSIARRGIEQFKEGNLAEAQQQFEAALKLDRSNAWIYYNLGLLFLEQRNYDLAIDNFKVITLGDKNNARPSWLYVWSFIKLGNAYDAKGDRTRAVAAYKNAETTGDDYDDAQDAVKKYLAAPFDPKQKGTTTAVR